MALFSRTKKPQTNAAEARAPRMNMGGASVLKHARITEKASVNAQSGAYVFDVTSNATKRDVIRDVKKLYNVMPRKVTVVTIPRKEIRSMRTGKTGVKGGGKKAYVYLKSGESITLS